MTSRAADTARQRMPSSRDGEVNRAVDDRTGGGEVRIRGSGGAERAGARTPEELGTLLEDALVIRDRDALAALFAEGAVLVAGDDRPARGGAAIARLALATWDGDRAYVADSRRVVQARDVALVVTQGGINVARRSPDGAWRYTIVVETFDGGPERRTQ